LPPFLAAAALLSLFRQNIFFTLHLRRRYAAISQYFHFLRLPTRTLPRRLLMPLMLLTRLPDASITQRVRERNSRDAAKDFRLHLTLLRYCQYFD
jgi:hypothetical protein